MGIVVGPSQLLLFDEALGNDLMDGGLDEAAGVRLAMPEPIAIVEDVVPIIAK